MFMTPFGFSLNFSFWTDFFSLPVSDQVMGIIAIIGWVLLALLLFFMAAQLWVDFRQSKLTAKWKWVLLAVEIPALFVQTPKAIEQIFAHLSGALASIGVKDKYWVGKKQKWFSLEVISIEGYIQFLIRTEAEYRDLVEAAIYAQYSEAQITEVEDYVDNVSSYPNKEYDAVGVEFKLSQDTTYPIRTYADFQYNISADVVFSDPMAAILENFTRISKGENLWMQIVIQPTGNEWKEKGIKLVKSIITGKKSAEVSPLLKFPELLLELVVSIFSTPEEKPKVTKKEEPAGKVSDLSPGAKKTVEAIEDKISKIGFKSKIRLLYLARKESFNPSRCVGGFIGSLNQFTIMSSNGLTPYKALDSIKKFAKTKIFVGAFKKRKLTQGGNPYILNIEELATIWHFPLPFVKTPLVQKAAVKRSEPPINLPTETIERRLTRLTPVPQASSSPKKEDIAAPPENLPMA